MMMMMMNLWSTPCLMSCTSCLVIPKSILASLLATTIASSSSGGVLVVDDNPSSLLSQPPIPVLEVVKVYGKLAGPQCYGKLAPKGSSCQVTLKDAYADFGMLSGGGNENDNKNEDRTDDSLTRDDFRQRLTELEFQWPLKPYGVDKSNDKTATMNKGAETRIFMEELEQRGLYDKRNPTGPLPTSLRPQLNQALQKEGVNFDASDRIFNILVGERSGGKTNGKLQPSQVEKIFGNDLDYYGFLDLIGKESIIWPY